MLEFQTTPVPHEKARRRIAEKPAVARDVFGRLPEEMQSRAFTAYSDKQARVMDEMSDVFPFRQ